MGNFIDFLGTSECLSVSGALGCLRPPCCCLEQSWASELVRILSGEDQVDLNLMEIGVRDVDMCKTAQAQMIKLDCLRE